MINVYPLHHVDAHISATSRAGGYWRTHASASEAELCRWDAETYARWMELVSAEDEKKSATDKGIHCGLGVTSLASKWHWCQSGKPTKDVRRFTQLTTSGSR